MAHNKIGDFSLAEEELLRIPEDRDPEQEPIEEWVKDTTKVRLLVLATLAGRVSADLVAALQVGMPTYEWRPRPDVTADMDEEDVRKTVAGSQPRPSAIHRLTPPEIKGKELAADAVSALIAPSGEKTIPCTITAKTHQSKRVAREMWATWWHLIMDTELGVETDEESEEPEGVKPLPKGRVPTAKVNPVVVKMMQNIIHESTW